MNQDMVKYYKHRASEYEQIYDKPERQADLAEAAGILKALFPGKNVLEIACGTGYWTQQIAKTANSILATDINREVLDIARQKHYLNANVSFDIADFNNYNSGKKFESLFGGFILSHIKLQELDVFFTNVLRHVANEGTVVFIDNRYIEESSIPVAETDIDGNTYQHRRLKDGSVHRLLKNFLTEDVIKGKLPARAVNLSFINLKHYWIAKFSAGL